MAVTSQQIADAAGVSRATVDRALKNRGRVKPEVAERIKEIAREMGYQPNQAARALALAKHPIKIGVVLQSAETLFMHEVLSGIKEAREEVERMGGKVYIRKINGVDAKAVVRAMNELKAAGIDGIALVPAQDRIISQTINRFADEHDIPVVTFNSDISDSKRICFVGQDGLKSGAVAAGLMAESAAPDSPVAVISGTMSNPAMLKRVKGFNEVLTRTRPDIQLLTPYLACDEGAKTEAIVTQILEEYPDLGGIYISTPAVDDICRALCKNHKESSVKVIANDILDSNIAYLKKGVINFLIGQGAQVQGYEPVMILFRKLVGESNPASEYEYTEIVIKTQYNI